jgi:hypothetical protein
MAAKFALIIGNSQYDDPHLGRLKAPDLDVQGLEEVLRAPDIGHFDEVTTLLNQSCAEVRKAVARFYERRLRDDLLLLYFSGHGVKDEQGHLYLAVRDSEIALLAGSAIETAFITGRMDRSFSKQQVLVLDCCHSGAFDHGAKAAQGVSVGTAEAFEGTGLGRVILSATDATQYAWEGDRIIGDAETSLFTHFMVDGLRTGAADLDDDGVVTVDELYDYVRDRVVDVTPRQTPRKWSYRREGDLVIAQNPFAKRSKLPPEIEEARSSKLWSLRLKVVRHLEQQLRGGNTGQRRATLVALKELAQDHSRKVANAATEALKAYERERPSDVETDLIEPALRHREVKDVAAPRPTVALPDDRRITGSTTAAKDERREIPPSDIFISYEHNDRQKAKMLANALVAEGWTVWWDRRIAPGEAFDLVIERELASCKCVIVLWTARSVGATWVRNEARRAAKRRVLVPILMEAVEPPLEFENLQAADLTSWEANAEHPEFDAVRDRIQALAPRTVRLARVAVENAMRDFSAGRTREALTSLEQFRPPNPLVSQAIENLKAEATHLETTRAEVARQRAEAARHRAEALRCQQRLLAAKDHIEKLFERAELDAAEQALAAAEKEFESTQELPLLRERLNTLRAARAERVEREHFEAARRESEVAERPTEYAVEDGDMPITLFLRPDTLGQPEEQSPRRVLDTAIETHPQKWSGLHSRGVQTAIAAGLVIIVGLGIAISRRAPAQGSANDPSFSTSAPPAPTEPPSRPTREPASSPGATRTEAPFLPSTRIDGSAPTRAPARENRPDRVEPGERPETRPGSRISVDDLRTRARNQRQAGDGVQALNTVVEGLRLYPKDAGLTAVLNSVWADSQAAAAQSKRDAMNVDAEERAKEIFGAGLQKEREAERLRRLGRTDTAIRALWAAADQFRAAAAHARQVAEEEAAKQVRIDRKASAGGDTQTPPRDSPAPDATRKLPDSAVEEALVVKTLRRYEAAYAALDADAVKSVFPAAPIEQLMRDFAGYGSYSLSIKVHEYNLYRTEALTWMNVPATIVHVISPKSGETTSIERSQTIQLVKQGGAWVIRQIR